MNKVENEYQIKNILNVVKKNIEYNLYLYLDIITYDIADKNIIVWFNDFYSIIVLKYYNSFQLFFTDNFNFEYSEVIKLIKIYKPSMISGEKSQIENLASHLSEFYHIESGYVLIQDNIKLEKQDPTPVCASESDLNEIVELIFLDESISSHYDKRMLINQFSTRLKEGFGRNYIIKDKKKIIAHYATYAEIKDMAILGGMIVHPNYRGFGMAKILHSYLSNILLDEGKKPYLFCLNENALNMYLHIGAHVISKYGKLTLKQ